MVVAAAEAAALGLALAAASLAARASASAGSGSSGESSPSWPAAALVLGGLVSLWRWAAALQQALVAGGLAGAPSLEPPQEPQQQPEMVKEKEQQQQGKASSNGDAPSTSINSPSPGRAHDMARQRSGGRAWTADGWATCVRVGGLSALLLAGLWLLMGQWALCYALLLATLPCFLATRPGGGSQAGTAAAAVQVLVAGTPAGLLVWGACSFLGANGVALDNPGVLLAVAQWLACFAMASFAVVR